MCNFTKTYNAKYYRNFPFTALSYSVIVIFYTSRCYYKFQPLLRITVVSSIDIVHIILHLILCIFPTGKVHFFSQYFAFSLLVKFIEQSWIFLHSDLDLVYVCSHLKQLQRYLLITPIICTSTFRTNLLGADSIFGLC